MIPPPKRHLPIPDYISPENTEIVHVRWSLKDLSGSFLLWNFKSRRPPGEPRMRRRVYLVYTLSGSLTLELNERGSACG